MANFVLTCCSTADLPAEYFEKRQIPYLCFHFTLDGKEYDDDLGKSIPFERFYKMIQDGAQPVTSQVNAAQYEACWEPYAAAGTPVVHLTLSSGISGTYNSAQAARESLLERYPNAQIFLVDSLGASSGYGLLVDAVCDLRDAGATAEEAARWAEENRLKVHHWFFSTDLTSYLRGGRISKSEHFFGSMLGICPLLNMDNLGRLIPRSKYRGKKRVMEEMVKRMEEHAQDGHDYLGKCFLSHSACLTEAKAVADLVEARFPKLSGKVMINSVGTTIGSHTGPGTVALFFFGDERKD
ncbi:MAG: DegV family protein [Pygmaiobacter massiliensis]|nr:DegV family protein [Pygmaiobacter massiliensis]